VCAKSANIYALEATLQALVLDISKHILLSQMLILVHRQVRHVIKPYFIPNGLL